MTKRLLAYGTMLLMIFTLYACSQGESPVNKLKEPANSSEENNEQVEEILAMKDLAIPDLIALLSEEMENDPEKSKQQWSAKVTAMNILSELKAEEALPVLKAMLETSDSVSAINNSARTIGRIGGENAFIILDQVLSNTQNSMYTFNNERRKAVIAALGLCENRKAVPLLMEELENRSNDLMLQIYAGGSLALLGRNDGLPVVTEALSSDDGNIRLAATRALGLIGAQSSVSSLNSLTKSENKYIYRKAARLSLIQIEEKNLTADKKTAYIREQLIRNHGLTEILQWGTLRLKKINTNDSKNALLNLSGLSSPDSAALKHAAKMRLMTME